MSKFAPGMKVDVRHAKRWCRGIIVSFAAKRSKRLQQNYWWIRLDKQKVNERKLLRIESAICSIQGE